MSHHELEDEMQEMFEHEKQVQKVLSNRTIQEPIRNLELGRAVVVETSKSVSTTIELMQHKKTGCVLAAENGVLVGIFTERDILMKILGKAKDYHKLTIGEVMTKSPESLRLDDSIAYAMNMMSVGGYRHVPIVDDHKKPISILSVKDVISYIVEHFPDEVLNLPPTPLRSTKEREGA
ncbi:MAG TPA: CBS domain-containing protein [Bacteroidota bacterium]|nr:CBS domain-containing protein [Bacteroidota bacterium]